MSRFWAAGGSSSSDSESDSDSSSDSDDSGHSGGGGNAMNDANRWLAMSDDSSDEDSVRVVLSGAERFQETVKGFLSDLKKHMKARDYYQIQVTFDALAKAMIKNKQYLSNGVPRPLVRILCDLEDYTAERLKDKEQFKKLSARQGRALNRMKLTLRKHNKAYATVMKAYRANPVVSDAESESSDDDVADDASASSSGSSSSSNSGSSSSSSSSDGSGKEKDSDDDSDGSGSTSGDDDEWDSDSDDSASEDDGKEYAQLKGRARWLKKNTVATTKVVKNKEDRAKEREAAKLAAAAAAAQQEAVTATKSVIPEEGLTAAILNRRCSELAAQRRGKDAVKQLRELSALLKLSYQFGPRTEIPITMNCVAAQFALQRTLDDYMDTATWKSCAAYLTRVADVLDEGYTIQVETVDASDLILAKGNRKMKAALTSADGAMAAVAADEKLINPTTGAAETEDERAERLRVEKEAEMTEEEKKVICVTGSLSLHLTRLEEEYTKSLQKVSHHSEDYIVRLRDESKLVLLLSRFQAYFERINDTEAAAVLAQLRVEHLYYRHDSIAVPVDKAAVFYEKYGEATALHPACIVADASVVGSTDFSTVHPGAALGKPSLPETEPVDFEVVMGDLCQYVYKHATDAQKTRAMICQIYHAALHDRFVDARDLLLMSHLQESIYDSDVATMILFNRMMVTLGMCAFRLGRIHDAHQCLYDICSGRVRELLAQGVNTSRFSDKSAEQEKAEKRRLVPYHQHINLDLLEACHLISAMLLEVPNMAGTPVDGDSGGRRHRVISRTFRKFHDQYNHQVFTGPPEQTRDFIMRAAKSLMNGDWKNCASLVTGMDVWNLVPGEGAAKVITDMLTDKIKLEGLRTYLFAFSAQYDSLSLSQLCDMFEMSKTQVHSVVSKMMINRELYASWDQSTETIVLRKVEPSSLQIMALQFSEKASVLVEANERLLDAQSGGYGYKDDRDDRGGRGGYRGRGDGGGYRGGGGDYNNRNGRGGGGRSGGNNGRGGGRGGRGRSSGRGGGRGRGGRSGRGSGRGGRSNSNNNRRY